MESPKTEILELKKEELISIKKELKKVKETTTQSWLDSRSLIDELERLKSNVEASKNRISKSNVVVSELEAELEATNGRIMSAKEGELESMKKAGEMSQALDRLREETEGLKRFAGEKRKKKLKMRRVLRARRQRRRTLQLRIEAARMETEACFESGQEAVRYLKVSETECDDQVLQLSHEEYMALKKRVEEESSLADWRVSVAAEQRIQAEKERDSAKAVLREMKLGKRMRRLWEWREKESENVEGEERVVIDKEEEKEEKGENLEVLAVVPVPELEKEDLAVEEPVKRSAETEGDKKKKKKKNGKKKKKKKNKKNKKTMFKGKKIPIFRRIKQCFVFDIIGKLCRRT